MSFLSQQPMVVFPETWIKSTRSSSNDPRMTAAGLKIASTRQGTRKFIFFILHFISIQRCNYLYVVFPVSPCSFKLRCIPGGSYTWCFKKQKSKKRKSKNATLPCIFNLGKFSAQLLSPFNVDVTFSQMHFCVCLGSSCIKRNMPDAPDGLNV